MFFLLAIPLALASCKPKTIKLHLALDKDKTYHFIIKQNSDLQQTYQGKINKLSTEIEVAYAFKVTDIPQDTLYHMEVSYEHLHLEDKTRNGLNDFYFDSDNSFDHNPFKVIFASVIKHPFNIVMTQSGKISFITNMDKQIDDALNYYPSLSLLDRDRMKTRLQRFLGETAFRKNVENWTAISPGKALKEDDKWHIKKSMGDAVPSVADVSYQLTSIDKDGQNIIKATAKVMPVDTTNFMEENGARVKYNLPGDIQMSFILDEDTGWISEAIFTQQAAGKIEFKAFKAGEPNIIIPMSLSSLGTVKSNKETEQALN